MMRVVVDRRTTLRPRFRGQSFVELAITLPLLLLVLLGTTDLGRMFVDYVQMRNAAFRGARYGMTAPSDTSGIRSQVTKHGVPADVEVTVICGPKASPIPCGSITSDIETTITVRVTRTFTPVATSFLQHFFGLGPVDLRAEATARVAT